MFSKLLNRLANFWKHDKPKPTYHDKLKKALPTVILTNLYPEHQPERKSQPLPIDEIEAPEVKFEVPRATYRACQREGCFDLMVNPHYNRKYHVRCAKMVNKAQVKEWDARRRKS